MCAGAGGRATEEGAEESEDIIIIKR